MADLTTLASVKELVGITATTFDAVFNTLISQVSQQVEKFTDRDFELGLHTRWLDGKGEASLFLPEWPVRSIQQLAIITEGVGNIQFDGGTVATVGWTTAQVELFSIDNTGTELTTELELSANPILSDVKTAVEAVTGWTFDINSGKTTVPSNRVRPFQTDDALSSARVEIWAATESRKTRIVDGTDRAISMLSFSDDVFFGGGHNIGAGLHSHHALAHGSIFPHGTSNVFVKWRAGYDLPAVAIPTVEALPVGLVLTVNRIINDVFQTRKTAQGTKSIKIADFSESFTDSAVGSAVQNRADDLMAYKTIELVSTI